jgi:hypothetical protein
MVGFEKIKISKLEECKELARFADLADLVKQGEEVNSHKNSKGE